MPKLKLLTALLLCLSTAPALAQTKVTRIIVAFAPGGPVDAVARFIADQLGKETGTTVVIENKPGANGAIGANEVKKSPPDGRTLWLTSVGAVAINPALYPNLSYSMETDFQPISLVVNNEELLVVSQKSPYQDAKSFFEAAKTSKDPLTMASSGVGSIPHLAIEQVTEITGIRFLHVPYRGAAPAINDVITGNVNGFFGDVPGLIGQVQAGGLLRPIGLAAKKRHPLLPNVPTLEEQGYKGIDTNNWYALYAPANTPPDIVAALNKAVYATLAEPVTKGKLLAAGAEPAHSTPEELAALQKRDAEKWARIIRAKNIKAE